MKKSRTRMAAFLIAMLALCGVLALTGCHHSSNPTLEPPYLVSIEVNSQPGKTTYELNEGLDLAGMVVTGTYSDGNTKTETITTANISGFDSSTPGDKLLTVTVNGKTASFTVKVVNAETAAAEFVTTYSTTLDAEPSAVTDANKADIEAALAAYDALSDEAKALVDTETKSKVTALQAKIDELNNTVTAIAAASVSGLVAPVTDGTPGTTLTPGAAAYTVESFTWSGSLASGKFAASTAYIANITLKANANYQFDSGITPTTNLGTTIAPVSDVVIGGEASENSVSFKVVFAATDADVPVDTRVLAVDAIPVFDAVTYGYTTRPAAKNLTIRNSGNAVATISNVALSGTGASAFELGGTGTTVNTGGSITTRTVQPKAGLAAGMYTATITVTYDGTSGTTTTADVSITVANPTGTGNVVIQYWVSDVNDANLATNTGAPTLSRGAGDTAFINAATIGFTDHQWSINGTDVPAPTGTASSYTFDSAGKGNGTYNIELQVKKGTAWYSTIITIMVTN